MKLAKKPTLRPSINPLTAAAPKASDPLAGIEYEGTIEKDSPKEISALLAGFKQRAKKEEKRFRDTTDSGYWCAICFQSRDQRDAFFKAMSWPSDEGPYLDGVKIAEQLKVPLPTADVRFTGEKSDAKMAALPSIRKVR